MFVESRNTKIPQTKKKKVMYGSYLGGTSNHVLDVISVSRAVDVSVMSLLGLVLDVGGRDGDTSGLLLGGLVDLVVVLELGTSTASQGLGDGSGQGGLSVIDVTNGSDVDVGLGAGELAIGGHGAASSHARDNGSAHGRGLQQRGLEVKKKRGGGVNKYAVIDKY